jgi:hypothetical protein
MTVSVAEDEQVWKHTKEDPQEGQCGQTVPPYGQSSWMMAMLGQDEDWASHKVDIKSGLNYVKHQINIHAQRLKNPWGWCFPISPQQSGKLRAIRQQEGSAI